MRGVFRLLASTLVLGLLFVVSAHSQAIQTGGIAGVVTDQTGGVVKGATVDVIDEGTGVSVRTITTGDEGSYSATLLRPGAYRVEVTAPNFKKAVIAGVQVQTTESTRVNVSLQAGRIEETVNVQATPTLINPESATTGQPLDGATLRTLPLASPNFLFLLNLSTGVTGEPTDVRSSGRGSADVTVNGQRTSNNSVSLEGINVNDFNLAHFDTVPLPNPSTLQEMKVSTSLYDASQGSKGGGAVGLVFKSGERDFHWEGYWSHRNDALNANEWFRNRQPSLNGKRARLLQNVFGGSGSGPVPKVGGFWFFNYQGVRARNGLDPLGSSLSPTIQNIPRNPDGTTSAALLAAAFGTANLPNTPAITAAMIDPVAVNILNLQSTLYGGQFLVPRLGQGGCATTPTGVGTNNPGVFTCQISAIAPIYDNQYTIAYDRSWRNGNDKISGRWFWDNGAAAKPYATASSLAFPRTDTQFNRFLSITETHVLSPTKVNELRLGYSRFSFANIPTDSINLTDIGATRGNSSQFPGVYQINNGVFSIGTGVNDDRGTISNTYNVVDTFSWSHGKHSFRIGGESVQYQLNRFNNFAVRGSLTTGSTTGVGNTFSAFQNFLQGRITAIQSAFGDPARNFVATDFSGFVQDDYRWSPRLTFNVGLRWEGMSFGHDKLYRAGVFDPLLAAEGKNPFLIPEKVDLGGFKGTPGVSDCALKSCFDGNNFGPRVGFAFDVWGDQKTIVRGGYGIYYQRLSNQNILQNSLAAPFTVQPLSSNPNPPGGQLANPFGTIPPPSIIASAFIPSATFFAGLFNINTGAISVSPNDVNDPNFRPIFVNEAGQRCLNYASHVPATDALIGATNCSINLASFTSAPLEAYTPYTQQWNLTLQRELGRGWAAEIGYVGSHFTGGLGIWDPYLAKLASPASPITVRDKNGVSYTINANTANNEELRHQILGLSRKRGSRYSGNIGFGTYNSLQATLSRRLSRGLYFQAAYTWSHTIDNVSGSYSTDELNATRNGQGGANIFNDQSNAQQNKARGDFDRPHRLVVSYSYDLPAWKNNQLFKGWAISGIVTYQNGLPFSVTDTGGGAFGGGTSTGRFTCANPEAAYTVGSTTDILLHYLNISCWNLAANNVPNFAGSGATGYGNTPRNAFRGPFQQNWDFSVQKRFQIKEGHEFQFRMDMFNMWNHPVFGFPSSVSLATPSTFAQITTTVVPARLIQFGVSYRH